MAETTREPGKKPIDRVIRVFVSSTFADMHAEREELVKRVFPELRKLCEARGVTWGEVDLRWGIPDECKAEGKVLPICLAEIQNCRPYFIGSNLKATRDELFEIGLDFLPRGLGKHLGHSRLVHVGEVAERPQGEADVFAWVLAIPGAHQIANACATGGQDGVQIHVVAFDGALADGREVHGVQCQNQIVEKQRKSSWLAEVPMSLQGAKMGAEGRVGRRRFLRRPLSSTQAQGPRDWWADPLEWYK